MYNKLVLKYINFKGMTVIANLNKAISIEKHLRKDNKFFTSTFIKVLQELGFNSFNEYLDMKKDFLFKTWNPEVHRIDIEHFAEEVEYAIENKQYGIYIPVDSGIHVYHGGDDIDYKLCEELNVKVIELKYNGGNIIGSSEDLSIEIIFPEYMNMSKSFLLKGLSDIISKYIPNVTVDNNDILVDGKKICGCMTRMGVDTFVWAAQISFKDYSELINKICTKASTKTPSYINSELLNKNLLEKEFLDWLGVH